MIFEVSTRLIDEDGKPVGVQGTCRDITARTEADAQLRELADLNHHQATHDQLTGLPNRAYLQQQLEQAVNADGRLALLVVDLDRFKEINDSLGHHCGDLLLCEVAARLRDAVRAPDSVARLGGDEFGILLPTLSANDQSSSERVEQIKATLEQPVFVQGIPIAIEASIGLAFHPEHGDTVELLLQHADVAMYIAKHQHRGHATYNPHEDDNDPNKIALLDELHRAINNGELTLDYQPTVHLRTGNIDSVEALVRWQHPTRGLIMPDQFIPIVEKTALIKPLTHYVIEHALRQCKQWEQHGHFLTVAVNLSARNLAEPDLADYVGRILRKWNLTPKRLLLEITETAVLSDPARADRTLRTLHALGIELALDDFGVGYTSLAYLADLPLNQVKIDRSFIADIRENNRNTAIVEAVIHLSNVLQLQVVAEGVSNTATLEKLCNLNCDIAQGDHFTQPIPPDKLIQWLEQHQQTGSPTTPPAATSNGVPEQHPTPSRHLPITDREFRSATAS